MTMQHHCTMNKLPLLVCCLCMSLLSAGAQVRFDDEEFALGIRSGAVLSSVGFHPQVIQQQRLGLTGGLTFRYCGEKNLGIQVETNYVQKGWREIDTAYSRCLNYVEIPLLSHFFFGKGIFRWFFNIGPQISFLINSKSTESLTAAPQHTEPVHRRFDYGVTGGTGFEFNTRRAGIYQLEARYAFGFGDFFDNSTAAAFTQSKHRTIMLTLGILFNLK